LHLRQLFFRNNACFIAGRLIDVKGIIVHSTGANNPNLRRYVGPDDGLLGHNPNNNHWNIPHPDGKNMANHPFVNNGNGRCKTCNGREVCVHAWIGRLANGSIATYQTLPWDMRGWHCGGSGNNTHIGFEICEADLNDKAYFDLVYQEAVELCAHLCKMFKLNPLGDGVLIDHAEGHRRGIAGNHADVSHWFPRHGKNMNTFRNDVRDALAGTTQTPASATPAVTPPQPAPAPTFPISETNIRAMVDLGIMNSPDYWRGIDHFQWLNELMANVAKPGMCDRRINNGVPSLEVAVKVLADAGIMNSPDYWRKAAEAGTVRFLDGLLMNMANRCRIILEKIVHAEAQGEGLEGQEYIANVILNRVNDRRFPDAIYPVVFASGINSAGNMVFQFSPIGNGAYARAVPSESVKNAVTNVLNGKDNSRGALYFRTIAGAAGSWHETLIKLFDHRNHRFYNRVGGYPLVE